MHHSSPPPPAPSHRRRLSLLETVGRISFRCGQSRRSWSSDAYPLSWNESANLSISRNPGAAAVEGPTDLEACISCSFIFSFSHCHTRARSFSPLFYVFCFFFLPMPCGNDNSWDRFICRGSGPDAGPGTTSLSAPSAASIAIAVCIFLFIL